MNFAKVAFAAAVAALPVVAHAAVIVETGPVPASVSRAVYGSNGNGNAGIGGRFTLTAATALTAIEFYGATSGNNIGSIRADGATPGASLFSGSVASTGFATDQWVGLTGLNWVLGPGSYWLTFESTDLSSTFREAVNFPNPLSQQVGESEGVFSAERDFRFAFRVEGDAVAAAPEPSSWAMMVAGFGLIGGAVRRRKLAVSLA